MKLSVAVERSTQKLRRRRISLGLRLNSLNVWNSSMEIFNNLATGFAVALTPINLLYCFLGSFIGTAIGVLPGLGPPATIALLLPVTYGIPATSAVILLAGIFYGAMYGGSTTSILLNIPGEAASVVTCLDGYQMARQGRAGAALAISAFGSFIAGTLSIVGLMLLAPPLASFAIKFGPPENFALLVLGLTMVGYLAGASMTKGLMMACLGLLLGTIGLDPIMGTPRFTYGVFKLSEGFEFILVAMGLFGIGEVLVNVEQTIKAEVFQTKIRSLLPNREEWRTSAAPIARGSLLGFFIGVLPGGGAIISSFISYALEKKLSKHPERFGKGAIEGVAAPEAANNSAATEFVHPVAHSGDSRQRLDRNDLRRAADPRSQTWTLAGHGKTGCLLGARYFHVHRQHHALGPESSADRTLGEAPSSSLFAY